MRKVGIMVLALFSALLLAGVAAADTIKIGLLAPTTGFAAADGESMVNAVKLAVNQVNADGGVLGKKIELVCYDDAADSKQAVALAHKMIGQDKVIAAVGGSYSMPTRAAAPIFDDEEIPFVAAYALHPDVTKGDYTFRTGFLGGSEGKAAGYVAVKLLKAKSVALLTSDNDYGRTLAAGFQEYLKENPSVKVVSVQTYPMSEKDFKAYLSKIKEAKPDVVFASGYYFQTGPMLKQAKEMGVTARFLGEEGADSPKTVEIAGPAAEGLVIVTDLDRDDPRPIVKTFLRQYRSIYKGEPDMVGASGYDAFMVIVDAIKRAKSLDRKAIRDAIAKTADFNGLTGVLKGFDQAGESVKPVQVQIVREGKFRHFGIVTDPKIIAP